MNTLPFDIDMREEAKMLPNKRFFTLTPMEGKKAMSSSGLPDARLFTGETKIYGIYDADRGTWSLKYDGGTVPGGLQGEFTEFQKLSEHVIHYYKMRNVRAEAVI